MRFRFSWPDSFFMTVVYGAKTWSSWFMPPAAAPLDAMTPRTRNTWFRTRICTSVGSTPSPKRLVATLAPSTHTFAAAFTSSGLKNEPYWSCHERMAGRSTFVPSICVLQLALP